MSVFQSPAHRARPHTRARRLGTTSLLAAIALAPFLASTAAALSASSAPSSTLLPRVGPMSTTSVTDRTSMTVTGNGTTSVTLKTAWDPTMATLKTSSATAPHSWNLEYFNGSAWVSSEPADLSTVSAVRTNGTVPSQGDGGSGNTLRTSSLSANVTGAPKPFAAASGGDGYDVAFPDATRVINVYHHNGPGEVYPVTVDCHLRSTGDLCPEGQIKFDAGGGAGPYFVANNARVTAHTGTKRAFIPAVRRSDHLLGFLCINYSLATPAKCATEFIPVSSQSSITALSQMGGAAFDEARFFVVNAVNHRLYCLDMATASICSGFGDRVVDSSTVDGFLLPTNNLYAPWGGAGWGWSSDISVLNGKVYFFHGNDPNYFFGCVDPSTPAFCSGGIGDQPSFPISAAGPFDFPPFPLYDSTGSTLQAVCLFMHRTCINPGGSAAVTMPAGLAAFLDPATPDGIDYYANVPFYFSLFEWGLKSNRLYFQVESGGAVWDGSWVGDVACWDFTTAAPCDFGTHASEPGIIYDNSPGRRLYSFVGDPYMDCVWSNSDSGDIVAMGTDGGKCGGDGSMSRFSFDEDDARLDCDATADPIRWTHLNLTIPDGLDLAKLSLTVRDGEGNAVSGWDGLAVTSTSIDLSSLTISSTGAAPTFDISLDNTGLDIASEVTAELQYVTPPPELCLELTPIATCTLGQTIAGKLPTPPFSVTHANTRTLGVTTDTDSNSVQLSGATYDAESLCGIGTLEGTTTELDDGSPVAGITVTLRDPVTGDVLATTTTDPSGAYRFEGLTPGTYRVEFSNASGLTVTPDSATASPTIVVGETSRADGFYEKSAGGPSWNFSSFEGWLLPETGSSRIPMVIGISLLLVASGVGTRSLRRRP